MSGGNHTPGPWRIGKAGPNLCPTVGTADGLMVAMVTYGDGHPAQANAELIASAPSMKNLIERLITWDKDFPVNSHNGYAGLKELDRIIADGKALVGVSGAEL